MKQASSDLINFLENTTQYVRADLYPFTLNGGSVSLRYSSANMPITNLGSTWNLGPPISDEGVNSQLGVQASTVDVTILGGDGRFTVNGEDILDFIEGFGFDGATARIDRVFAASWSDMYTSGPVGSYNRFSGYISEVKELGQTQAVVTISSWLDVLQVPYPAEVYQTSCLNTFCDSKCTLNLADFTATAAVAATHDQLSFDVNFEPTVDYTLGVVTFTSGTNAGISRSIKAMGGSTVTLTAPIPSPPAVGDTMTISQGCALSMAACTG